MIWRSSSNTSYTQGNIYKIAGTTGSFGFSGDGGPAVSALLGTITGICKDSSGRIFIADQGFQRIRMFTIGGNISTVAGTGTFGYNGDGIPATSAFLSSPQGVFADSSNAIYVAESARVRRFRVGGNVSTVAGTGVQGFSGDGGLATSAQIVPYSFYIDNAGNVYMTEPNNNRIRKFREGGNISTIAGTGSAVYTGNGASATLARFDAPRGIFIDNATGDIYIADTNNNFVRKIDGTTKIISSIAGIASSSGGTANGTAGGTAASYNGDNRSAISATTNTPLSVIKDNSGNFYFTEGSGQRIRKINSSGIISTIAGTNAGYSGDGSSASSAALNGPQAISFAATPQGPMYYIADTQNNAIRRVLDHSFFIAHRAECLFWDFRGARKPRYSLFFTL